MKLSGISNPESLQNQDRNPKRVGVCNEAILVIAEELFSIWEAGTSYSRFLV